MKERGILFSAPMVRALLDGTKTQTRRVADTGLDTLARTCPYGQPGDRLWVRETFFAYGRWEKRHNARTMRDECRFVDMTTGCGYAYQYAADNPNLALAQGRGPTPAWTTRPAIFMPRVASRVLLEILSARVERLQDINEADAVAEGTQPVPVASGEESASYIAGYRQVWEAINGGDSWAANPWVWVLEFKRIESCAAEKTKGLQARSV